MNKYPTIIFLALLYAVLIPEFIEPSKCEMDIYAKIVPIGGIITAKGGVTKEEMRVPGKAILFQRVDCKNCLSSSISDFEGKYSAFLGEGKYRVIIGDCGNDKNQDCLAPGQPRIITVALKANPQFDFRLETK